MYISVPAVSQICHPIINSRFDLKKYPQLLGLQLADNYVGELQIDILIGAVYYWTFMTGEVK